MTQPTAIRGDHVDEFEMAAFADRRLSPADRERVEAHLAGCADCRSELLEVRDLMRRQARPRRLMIAAGLLATAAMLVIMVPTGTGTVRDLPGSSVLTTYGPTGDAPLGSLRFVWGAAPEVATYRLTVSGSDGATVWTGSVTDTAAALPDSVTLLADRRYFWVVDALLEDGSTRSTGLHEFRPVR